MTLPFRPFILVSCLILVPGFANIQIGRAAPSDGAIRITAAANVTLRELPSPGAPAVAQLPLGTEVADAGPAGLDKTWVRVKLSDAREGWVLASLTRPIDPAWRWPTFDRIIAERLGRKGDGFPAFVELVAFIDRVAPEYSDPDGLARLELSRLRAMSSALAAIPRNGGRREPYMSWIGARKSEVLYDEAGSRWMFADSTIWERHARLVTSPVAEEIAWFAVTNGLSGECEGYLPCYVTARNRLHGEYLRRHPGGRRAAEAAGVVKSTADSLAAPVKSGAAYRFDLKRDCRGLLESVDALTAAVQATHVDARDATLASLATLRKMCQ